jgi:glycosyltransferase involved in cell wall biosynthesis
VLHVLPVDISRGAQTYARELCRALDDRATRHRSLTLFRSSGGTLEPDDVIDVAPGALRRAGLDPRARRGLRRVLRAERPDIVVAHGGEPLKYAVLAGVPQSRLVYYKIGAGNARLTGPRRWLHARFVRRAGVVAAVSDAAAREALELGVAPERLRVIPNGRDPSRFSLRVHCGTARPRLVFIAHLDPPKRPQRFCDVVAALRGRGLAVEAAIAGDGPLLDSLRPAAAAAGVELLGNVDDVPALLSASDVLVLTSAPMEGMPGVLIEAGLAGLPSVTTDVPGAADVVEHGETGFVVGVDDLDGLVDATAALVEDADLRARLGAAARRRCEERYGLEAGVHLWRSLLAELIADPCTSST